jgi:hypothetical protein
MGPFPHTAVTSVIREEKPAGASGVEFYELA